MIEVRMLTEKRIHDVFDANMENSYVVIEDGETLGYVCYEVRNLEKGRAWMEFILAEHRGRGDGEKMIHALFEQGIKIIQGSAIYGPHFFWESIGAVFESEVEEDDYDGVFFTLTKQDFYKER